MAVVDGAQLQAGVEEICRSPSDDGVLKLIVVRPAERERQVLAEGQLDSEVGLVGDSWSTRWSSRTEDGSPHPDMQLTLMNSRVATLLAGPAAGWPVAGDQLYVDLDLSLDNLPAGTQLSIGSSVIEVTAQPHTGCKKFIERFGVAAQKWVSSSVGRAKCLRGINARVVRSGRIAVGDAVRKRVASDESTP